MMALPEIGGGESISAKTRPMATTPLPAKNNVISRARVGARGRGFQGAVGIQTGLNTTGHPTYMPCATRKLEHQAMNGHNGLGWK